MLHHRYRVVASFCHLCLRSCILLPDPTDRARSVLLPAPGRRVSSCFGRRRANAGLGIGGSRLPTCKRQPVDRQSWGACALFDFTGTPTKRRVGGVGSVFACAIRLNVIALFCCSASVQPPGVGKPSQGWRGSLFACLARSVICFCWINFARSASAPGENQACTVEGVFALSAAAASAAPVAGMVSS